jgi:hypothetical protein
VPEQLLDHLFITASCLLEEIRDIAGILTRDSAHTLINAIASRSSLSSGRFFGIFFGVREFIPAFVLESSQSGNEFPHFKGFNRHR